VIRFTRVSKRFGSTLALEEIDWEVAAGERVAVLGASGAGKTTLLRLITMEILPTTGTVHVGDFVSARTKRARRQLLRRSLGIVFEDIRLLPDRSVLENLVLALNVRGLWERKRVEARAVSALGEVGMETRVAAFPGELSAGERQRVAVARALVGEPLLIVADEPTRHLGPRLAERLLTVMLSAHARGATLVLATNDEWVARTLGGRVTRLTEGRLQEDAGAAAV
jgi:cell division transport system ATP-binding protein